MNTVTLSFAAPTIIALLLAATFFLLAYMIASPRRKAVCNLIVLVCLIGSSVIALSHIVVYSNNVGEIRANLISESNQSKAIANR